MPKDAVLTVEGWLEHASGSKEADLFDIIFVRVTGELPPWGNRSGWSLALGMARRFREDPERCLAIVSGYGSRNWTWVLSEIVLNQGRFSPSGVFGEEREISDFVTGELSRVFNHRLDIAAALLIGSLLRRGAHWDSIWRAVRSR